MPAIDTPSPPREPSACTCRRSKIRILSIRSSIDIHTFKTLNPHLFQPTHLKCLNPAPDRPSLDTTYLPKPCAPGSVFFFPPIFFRFFFPFFFFRFFSPFFPFFPCFLFCFFRFFFSVFSFFPFFLFSVFFFPFFFPFFLFSFLFLSVVFFYLPLKLKQSFCVVSQLILER